MFDIKKAGEVLIKASKPQDEEERLRNVKVRETLAQDERRKRDLDPEAYDRLTAGMLNRTPGI